MDGLLRGAALACLTGGAACTLVTFGTDREARVEVDPVIRQQILVYGTGELIENSPVQDRGEVACAMTSRPTCLVVEFVRVTVFNRTPRPLRYEPECPPPLQRLGPNGWEGTGGDIACRPGTATPPLDVAPGETATTSIYFLWYDWRSAVDELRVELDLSDRNGDLPLEFRVSEPFRLTLE